MGKRNPEARKRYAQSDKAKAARARWHAANPGRRLFQCARLRAKDKVLPFNITVEDCAIPERCPILGIPLFHSRGFKGGPRANSPTLDRIIPALGYVKGNVMVISHRANTIKTDATASEVRAVADFLEAWACR